MSMVDGYRPLFRQLFVYPELANHWHGLQMTLRLLFARDILSAWLDWGG